MTETTEGAPAPAPKKRSFFKRAAWQDAKPSDGEDMFSHSNEFKDIVAEENRRRREQEEERQRRHAQSREKKRRKVSLENEAIEQAENKSKASKTSKTTLSSKSPSPALSHALPDSLVTRYEALTKPIPSNNSPDRKKPLVIDLDDDDYVPSYQTTSTCGSNLDPPQWRGAHAQAVPVYSSRPIAIEHDELEEVPDPMLAALEVRARERAAMKAQAAKISTTTGEPFPTPVAQLLISPQVPNTDPLMVKVRIDSTIQKSRQAWCTKQGFGAEMAQGIFFTWKGRRLHDSTTIQRLDLEIDKYGNVSVKGDPTIYDADNIPKILVEAWTEELFKHWEEENAAEEAAKLKALEAPLEIEEREPTPEPVTKTSKLRVTLKEKGKPEYGLTVKPESTFADVAKAYKRAHKIDEAQPITLMFDGERLSPLDTIVDAGIEDMDGIDVFLK